MYNILIENIHDRMIEFMKDLLTVGLYNLVPEMKNQIKEFVMKILDTIETCLDCQSAHGTSDGVEEDDDVFHQSIPPTKPPRMSGRSFSLDTKRKVSQLYAVQRAQHSETDLSMYENLVTSIFNQLQNLVQYMKVNDVNKDHIDVDNILERIHLIFSITKSCRTISSNSDMIACDEEILKTPTAVEFCDPLHDRTPHVDEEAYTSEPKLSEETNNFGEEEHEMPKNNDKTVVSITDCHIADHLSHHILEAGSNDKFEADDVSRESCKQTTKCNEASSKESSVCSFSQMPIKDKIQLFTSFSSEGKNEDNTVQDNTVQDNEMQDKKVKDIIKPSTKSFKKLFSRKLKKPRDEESQSDGDDFVIQHDVIQHASSLELIPAKATIRRLSEIHAGDKREQKQLKIRLKTMRKSVNSLKRREELAVIETEEWKNRFDIIYSQLANTKPVCAFFFIVLLNVP